MTMPSAPTWVDILTPTQCPCCGQSVMPTAQDYLNAFTTSMDQFTSSMSQWVAGPTGMATGAATAPTAGSVTRRHMRQRPGRVGSPTSGWGQQQPAGWHTSGSAHQHHAGCGCGGHDHGGDCGCGCGGSNEHDTGCRQCRADDCHCQCCIGDDLDLVVYSRLGERRIVPITITNERRREREVTLELSGFKTKGGREVPVTGAIVGADTFTLAPCEERAVTITVESSEPAAGATGDNAQGNEIQAPDVDDCLVAVADLRVEGCDIRCPIGIGVVLLPRDCDAFDLGCGCGCC